MALFTFIFWLLISILFLRWFARRQDGYLGFGMAATAFVLRVFFGCFYGYSYKLLSQHADTWDFFEASIAETAVLRHHPLQFIYTGILDANGHKGNIWLTFFDPAKSYFTDLHDAVVIKLMAVCNLLSGGHYYTNVIFFNWIVFGGNCILLRFFLKLFPGRKRLLTCVLFFYPPFLFWTAGFHRDGLLLCLLALFLDKLYDLFIGHGQKKKTDLLLLAVSWLGILFLRNFWALFLLPFSMVCVYLQKKTPRLHGIWVYTALMALGLVLFFLTSYLPAYLNLPAKLTDKQHIFFTVTGTYKMQPPSLDGSIGSFVHLLPAAFSHTFLRPAPWEWRGAVNLMGLFGQMSLWGSALLFLWHRRRHWQDDYRRPMVQMLFLVGFCNYMLIGTIVPYLSAIIRYKCVYELIFITLLLSQVDWAKITSLRIIKKFNMIKK